jgi:hypothetical protein
MPSLLRSILERFRGRPSGYASGQRRAAPRHRAELKVRLTLRDSLLSPDSSASGSVTVNGSTRDLSATGMAIIVPSSRIVDLYLTDEGAALRVELSIPSGIVEIDATAARYERLGKQGYLIGAHIAQISDREWSRYVAYLRTLR